MSPEHDAGRAPQAVLFADISGSVGIYAKHGDTVGFDLSSRCLRLMGEQVQRYGGRVIKGMGDGILAVHDDIGGAVHAACGMLAGVRDPGFDLEHEKIHIRVVVSFGTVTHYENDIFGEAVNVASRLLKPASADEILLTEAAFAAMPADMQASARSIGPLAIRGLLQPVTVYRYVWTAEQDTEQTTLGSGATIAEQLTNAYLELELDDLTFRVDREHPKVCIGRGTQNDIVIEHDTVSRTHAEITFRANRFALADKSANGTFIYPDNAVPLRLHREEVALFGNGLIVLGSKSGPKIVYRMAF